jgi:pimeloyl-ACP methyl ester carboxylesterase
VATDATVTNPNDGTVIAITVFQPAGASSAAQAPVVLESHGWGGSRSTSIGGDVAEFLDAGIGIVSIDQRGHGESGGQANVQDPDLEAEDISAVIDYIAALDWVRHDTDAAGSPIADDPVLGAIGGSYGGGYQTMTALDEIAEEGHTRFNALAPQITWYDLPESLAPQKVPRSAWDTLLYAAGASMLPEYVHTAQVWGMATGQWPDGTLFDQPAPGVPNLDAEFHEHSPVAFAERGIQIDVPVLLRQGISDNLFNLNEGIHIFEDAVSAEAQEESYIVGYNGGHALPNVLPRGTAAGSDACSPDGFTALTIAFYQRVFSGQSTDGLLPTTYNLTTTDGSDCLHYDNLDGRGEPLPVDPTGTGNMIATAGLGAPLNIEIAQGPITVSGIPYLSGTLTSLGLDNRAFFALSVGTSPADATVISNNVLPLREAIPVVDKAFEIELPGIAADVPEGQSLFLTISPVSDLSFGSSTKGAGGFLFTDLAVTPSVEAEPEPEPTPTPTPTPTETCGPPEGKGPKNGHKPPCKPE